MLAFDQSFNTLADLRSLGLPVIGSVSLAVLPPTIWERMRQIGAFGGALALLALVLTGVLLHFAQPA